MEPGIQSAFQDKHKDNKSQIITDKQNTAEHCHSYLQHTVLEKKDGSKRYNGR